MKCKKLQSAHHIGHLIKRPVITGERPSNLGQGIVPLVPDLIDQQINALFGRPVSQVKIQRENDAGRAVRTPE